MQIYTNQLHMDKDLVDQIYTVLIQQFLQKKMVHNRFNSVLETRGSRREEHSTSVITCIITLL